MINKNKVDLYNYTYLNANGYLDKFRNALGISWLDRPFLTKLLKIFNKDFKLVRFIIPNDKGIMCLYNKNTLNAILGVDQVGHPTIKPEYNRYLKYLSNLVDRLTYEEQEKPEKVDTRTDMEKASDELLYNDNYNPEIDESRTLSESYGEPQYGNLLWIRYSYKLATEDEDESYFVYSFETFDDGAYNNFNERCDEGDLRYYFGDDVAEQMINHEGQLEGYTKFLNFDESDSLDMTNVEQVEEYAKKRYGTTYNLKCAGYVLTDGSFLNFSQDGFSRTVDHHIDINGAGLYDLMKLGWVRLSPEAPGFEVMKPLTPAQKQSLKDFLRNHCTSRAFVDVVDTSGHSIFNKEYKVYDFPMIFSDINAVFNGTINNQSELSRFMESKKPRRAIFTEEQIDYVINEGVKYPVDTDKVKIVSKYLDDNFLRAGMPIFGEDGYPATMPIVVMKGTDGLPAKKMTDKQLFELLKDKFQKIYSDTRKVEKFIQQVMKDWYYKKITKQGMLSVNSF
jgi:hypothetical protein